MRRSRAINYKCPTSARTSAPAFCPKSPIDLLSRCGRKLEDPCRSTLFKGKTFLTKDVEGSPSKPLFLSRYNSDAANYRYHALHELVVDTESTTRQERLPNCLPMRTRTPDFRAGQPRCLTCATKAVRKS